MPPTTDNRPVKILVVDDLPEKLLVYRTVLDEPDYELVTARSGSEALRHVLDEDFAVILLDVNMPDMDGFETAGLVRTRRRSAHTPIIFITAYADDMHALKGYSYGAVDYILSPVVPAVLRSKVRVFVDLFRLNLLVKKQAAQQVAQAERERAETIAVLERATDFVARIDDGGRVLHLNRAGRKMLGFDEAAPIADLRLTIDDFGFSQSGGIPLKRHRPDHGEYRLSGINQNLKSDLAAAAREGVAIGESVLQTRDGSAIPVTHIIQAHKNERGESDGFSIIARDISERKRAEEIRSHLAAIVEASDDAIISKSLEGVITSCNRGAERLFGYSSAELVGQPVTLLIPPERRSEEQVILNRIRQGQSVEHFETVRMTKDGRRLDISLTVSPVRDSTGQITGASKIARDISESKRAERALRESESRLRAMFGQAAVGIVLADRDGRWLEVNDRMCQILGRNVPELCAMSFEDLTHPDDRPDNQRMIRQVAAGERAEFGQEKRYRHADGTVETNESWVWVNETVSPLLDERGEVHRVMAVVEDISARKTAEQELRQHREGLEQLVRERTSELQQSAERLRLADRLAAIGTLTAGLGHDMGNLLLPVRLRLQALERMNLPEAAAEHLKAISTCGDYLKRLSQGLRLFALDPEDDHAMQESTSIAAWWPDVEPFLRNALPRSVVFSVNLPVDLPPLAIPAHRLTQVIYNLVQNAGDALRGRPDGHVTLSVTPARSQKSEVRGQKSEVNGSSLSSDLRPLTSDLTSDLRPLTSVVISVADDGPGMTEEVKRRCLEPFFTTKARGISTGLGLALVHGAVVKAGGAIHIDSHPGRGTAFRLTLPLRTAEEVEQAAWMNRGLAFVNLRDSRLRAFVAVVLQSLHVKMQDTDGPPQSDVDLLVVDFDEERWPELEQLIQADDSRAAVVVGGPPGLAAGLAGDRIFPVETPLSPPAVRRILSSAIRQQRSRMQPAQT